MRFVSLRLPSALIIILIYYYYTTRIRVTGVRVYTRTRTRIISIYDDDNSKRTRARACVIDTSLLIYYSYAKSRYWCPRFITSIARYGWGGIPPFIIDTFIVFYVFICRRRVRLSKNYLCHQHGRRIRGTCPRILKWRENYCVPIRVSARRLIEPQKYSFNDCRCHVRIFRISVTQRKLLTNLTTGL